jgi:hypothetical protein
MATSSSMLGRVIMKEPIANVNAGSANPLPRKSGLTLMLISELLLAGEVLNRHTATRSHGSLEIVSIKNIICGS